MTIKQRTETAIQNAVRLVLSSCGCKMFRNNVGLAVYPDGSRVAYGLGEGSSDLIGWTPVVITEAMVGTQLAVFTAVETKKPGHKTSKKRLEAQMNFLNVVVRDGGIGAMVSDDAGVDELISKSLATKTVQTTAV